MKTNTNLIMSEYDIINNCNFLRKKLHDIIYSDNSNLLYLTSLINTKVKCTTFIDNTDIIIQLESSSDDIYLLISNIFYSFLFSDEILCKIYNNDTIIDSIIDFIKLKTIPINLLFEIFKTQNNKFICKL